MYLDTLTMFFLVVAVVTIVAVMIEHHLKPAVIEDCEHRARSLQAIQDLRLYKMLGLLKIPLDQYITFTPLDEIESHITACRGCTELGVCDRCLRMGVPEKDMGFCPNHESLLKHR